MTSLLSTENSDGRGVLTLTPDDVDRLLTDDSPESRSLILEKVAHHYNAQALSGREQEVAEQIFRLLMRDISVRVRQTLAERVQHNGAVPRDIVLHLAQDEVSVAEPVLVGSSVLSDADLEEIIGSSKQVEKLIAITRRSKLSERVSDALVETSYPLVIKPLLQNEGAAISDAALGRIAETHAAEAAVMDALTQRPNLPIGVVEHLISEASDAVAAELKSKYNLDARAVKEDSNKVREEFMLRLLDNEPNETEAMALATQMAEDGSLTPSLIMTALCRGQLMFFTAALAVSSGITYASASRLLADRGEYGFGGIYKKSSLPDSMMDAVRFTLRAVQGLESEYIAPGTRLYANRLVARLVEEAGEQSVDYLPYFLAMIRQNAHRL